MNGVVLVFLISLQLGLFSTLYVITSPAVTDPGIRKSSGVFISRIESKSKRAKPVCAVNIILALYSPKVSNVQFKSAGVM